jgi:hypothetical protein
MNIAAIGSVCFGIVVGWIIRYFLFRFDKFNIKILGSTLSIIAGGAVIGFFSKIDPDKTVVWYYPIGLLLGLILYSIGAFLSGAPAKGGVYYVKEKEKD